MVSAVTWITAGVCPSPEVSSVVGNSMESKARCLTAGGVKGSQQPEPGSPACSGIFQYRETVCTLTRSLLIFLDVTSIAGQKLLRTILVVCTGHVAWRAVGSKCTGQRCERGKALSPLWFNSYQKPQMNCRRNMFRKSAFGKYHGNN